jgi:hypothetical protein
LPAYPIMLRNHRNMLIVAATDAPLVLSHT